MLSQIKKVIKIFIPRSIFKLAQPYWHGMIATLADLYFDHPSQKLICIGVTGTAGKSSTVMMLAHILNQNNKKTGYITTVGFSDGDTSILNKHGLSMPGGWLLQKNLAQLVSNGCQFAIIECTSEGMAQNRHLKINFSGAIFTNLSPAHLDSHGNFDNYRNAKLKLFKLIPEDGFIVVNVDDKHYEVFANQPVSNLFGVTLKQKIETHITNLITAAEINDKGAASYMVNDVKFNLNIIGRFNIYNALLATTAAKFYGITLQQSATALASYNGAAGRMEFIKNNLDANIIVDYAPEPKPLYNSIQTVHKLPHNRLIHVFGATGGHRDKSKRFEFGQISAQFADYIIVTNDDVYESNPQEIAAEIVKGIRSENPKIQHEVILSRLEALQFAIKILQPKDILLVTGKGSEQFLVLPGNKRILWDDREIIKQILES